MSLQQISGILDQIENLVEEVEAVSILAGDVRNFEIRPNLIDSLKQAVAELKEAKTGLHATLHGFLKGSPTFFLEVFQNNDLGNFEDEVFSKIKALTQIFKHEHALEEAVRAYAEVWAGLEKAGVKNEYLNPINNGQKPPANNGKSIKVPAVRAPATKPPEKYPGVMATALADAGVKAE